MASDRLAVESFECQRKMIDVRSSPRRFIATGSTEWRVDSDQVDKRRTRPKLNKPDLVDPALDHTADDIFIERDRSRQIAHAEHEMVEAFDLDRVFRHALSQSF